MTTTQSPMQARLRALERQMYDLDDAGRAIEMQLADPARMQRMTAADYLSWRKSAIARIQKLRAEQRALRQRVHHLREEARLRDLASLADEPVTEYGLIGALAAIIRRARFDYGLHLEPGELAFLDFAHSYLQRGGFPPAPPDTEPDVPPCA